MLSTQHWSLPPGTHHFFRRMRAGCCSIVVRVLPCASWMNRVTTPWYLIYLHSSSPWRSSSVCRLSILYSLDLGLPPSPETLRKSTTRDGAVTDIWLVLKKAVESCFCGERFEGLRFTLKVVSAAHCRGRLDAVAGCRKQKTKSSISSPYRLQGSIT